MTTAHRLRLEMLRVIAAEELQALNLDSPEECDLGNLLMLAIVHIDRLLKDTKGVAPDPARWR
jgi:hypothetical protein